LPFLSWNHFTGLKGTSGGDSPGGLTATLADTTPKLRRMIKIVITGEKGATGFGLLGG